VLFRANPSFPYRMTHMMLASGLTVAFLLSGISAYRWLKNDRGADVWAALKTGVHVAAVLIPLQIVVGDMHGVNTSHHQPAKSAAMEGIWKTEKGASAVLIGMPDAATQSNKFEVAIPKLASFYLTHEWEGEVKGIDAFGDQHPPVAPVFYAFRIMVGVGMLMLLVSWFSAWHIRRKQTLDLRLAQLLVAMTFAGWVALVAGWDVTEMWASALVGARGVDGGASSLQGACGQHRFHPGHVCHAVPGLAQRLCVGGVLLGQERAVIYSLTTSRVGGSPCLRCPPTSPRLPPGCPWCLPL